MAVLLMHPMQQNGLSSLLSPVATAAEKKDIVKKRLQELRNMCRDHYAVVAEESTMPDPADVRATNAKLQELMDLLDGKAKWDEA